MIPQDQYGAGSVIVWDRGHWIPEGDPRKGYAKGHLKFSLRGDKLSGDWNLVRMHPKARERGDNWLLIKATDDAARAENERDILDELPDSVRSGKPIETIADGPAARKWTRGQRAKPSGASSGALTPRQRARESLASSGATTSSQELAGKNAVKPLKIRFRKAARSARIGGFVAPCLAASTAKPPAGASFVHSW